MDIYGLMEILSDDIKNDVINLEDGRLDGKDTIRVTLGRFLTEHEKKEMKQSAHFKGVDSVWHHRYAPEIKGSYFYFV